MKILRCLAVATTFLLVSVVTGCGDDGNLGPDGAYCSAAKENQQIFIDDATGLGLITNIAQLREIAAKSPDDLKDEWQTFLGAVDGLRAAIAAAGLQPSDFVDGQPPDSATSRQSIAAAADRLGQQDVVEAANGIEQHAKDVCKLQLGL